MNKLKEVNFNDKEIEKAPLVSIIIVNFNGLKWLPECFGSLNQQTFQDFEVIFVDNASSDGSVGYVQKNYPQTKIVENNQNFGFAKGNNLGYEVSSGDYILLLNNDTRLDKEYLKNFIKVFDELPNCGVAQSKLLLMSVNSMIDSAGSFWTGSTFLNHFGHGKKDSLEYDSSYQVFSAKGASFLVRREVIEHIGLFDVEFWCYYEETDFCHRAWLAGYEVWYYPKAVCYHNLGSTSSLLRRDKVMFHNLKNKYISFIKNFEFRNMVRYILIYSCILNFYLVLMLFKGRLKIVWSILRSQVYVIRNFESIWRKRQQIQRLRKVSDREILKNLTMEMGFRDYWKNLKH